MVDRLGGGRQAGITASSIGFSSGSISAPRKRRRRSRAHANWFRVWRAGEVREIPQRRGNITMMQGEPLFRVLVVEDETLLRWALGEILRRSGHTVLEATSASDAREAMTRSPEGIDVVLLDFRLP